MLNTNLDLFCEYFCKIFEIPDDNQKQFLGGKPVTYFSQYKTHKNFFFSKMPRNYKHRSFENCNKSKARPFLQDKCVVAKKIFFSYFFINFSRRHSFFPRSSFHFSAIMNMIKGKGIDFRRKKSFHKNHFFTRFEGPGIRFRRF